MLTSLKVLIEKLSGFQAGDFLPGAWQSLYQLSYSSVYSPPEPKLKNLSVTPNPIAAGESGRVWGDPHFEGGDGGKFDVQGEPEKTYNLLTDTGMVINAKFVQHGKNKTVVGETGLKLSGPQGMTQISFQARPQARLTVNGTELKPGQSFATADGGRAALSKDGKTLKVQTAEGYVIEIIANKTGAQGEMEIKVRTPAQGVNQEGRLPAGLLGQSFDGDKIARNSEDLQGKGAIQGNYQDYEVVGGVFGDPSPKISPHATNLNGLAHFMKELGLPNLAGLQFPKQNPLTLESINWQSEIQQGNLQSLLRESSRKAREEVYTQNAKINRLSHLLLMALRSGNISLAMMLFAHLETAEANELTKSLVLKLRGLQDKKRQLSQQMMSQTDDAQGAKQTQMLKTEIESVNDDISILQTFIKDIAQNKQQAIEMANGFLNLEHQTTLTIVRTLGR